MMDVPVVLVALCTTAILCIIFLKRKSRRNYPRGPIGLPFLGNILQLDPRAPHVSLTSLAKKYGDVYSISMLGMDIVVVNGPKMIKEVLRSSSFAGRPYMFRSMVLTDSRYNVGLMSPCPRWRHMRQCETAALALQGEGLLKLERICTEVLAEMTEEIESYGGRPFKPIPLVRKSMVNILSSLLYGEKLQSADLLELLNIESEMLRLVAPTGNGLELDVFPWLRHIYSKNYDQLLALRERMTSWFKQIIQRREAEYKRTGSQAECAVDIMLEYLKKRFTDQGGQTSLCMDDIVMMNTDIIFAGTSTTTTTLNSFLAVMATRQDIQEKLFLEISQKLGTRIPAISDKKSMPYCNAVFLEILRYLTMSPIGLPHAAVEDAQLGKYLIPRNTQVWVNKWGLHHDEKLWAEPWSLVPERFLDETGNILQSQHEIWNNFYPFGVGKRACLGEGLATKRLFLSMVTLVQKFVFTPAEGHPPPTFDPRCFDLGVVLKPKDFYITAVQR